MSTIIPGHLVVESTRSLAQSALPDAPVEPDRTRTRTRAREFLRTLFRPATGRTPPAQAPARHSQQADPACC
jgi:hypothetical protein